MGKKEKKLPIQIEKNSEEKRENLKTITIILILFFVFILFFTGYSMGKSITNSIIQAKTEVAEPILKVVSNPKVDITATQNEGTYTFYVRNFDENGKTSEVDLNYDVEISSCLEKTIQMELYKNGEKIELTNNQTEKLKLPKQNKQEDKYELKIKYNKDGSNEMKDILDKIQVQVHSEQAKK